MFKWPLVVLNRRLKALDFNAENAYIRGETERARIAAKAPAV
jgi:hypothetical protein